MNEYGDLNAYEDMYTESVTKPSIIFKMLSELLFVSILMLIMTDTMLWIDNHSASFELFGSQISYGSCFLGWLGSVVVFASWHIASDVQKLVNPSYERSQDVGYKLIFMLASIVSLSCILIYSIPAVIGFWSISKQDDFLGWSGYIAAIAFILGLLFAIGKFLPVIMNHTQKHGGGNGFTFFLINLMGWFALVCGFLFATIAMFIIIIYMAIFSMKIMSRSQ